MVRNKIKVLAVCSLLIMVLMTVFCGFDRNQDKIYDYAGLLSSSEISRLEELAKTTAESIQADIIIATADQHSGIDLSGSGKQNAKKFYLEHGFGYDANGEGVIFLIDMEEREMTVFEYNKEASGYLYTDDEVDEIITDLQSDMGNGNYYEACQTFIRDAGYYATVDIGQNYDYQEGPRTESSKKKGVGVYLIIGAVSLGMSGIVALIMVKGRNKDRPISAAAYMQGKFHIADQHDMFIRTTVVKHTIQTSNGGGGGGGFSSGGTGGGGHGGSSHF